MIFLSPSTCYCYNKCIGGETQSRAERKPGAGDNNDSAMKQHEITGYDIHPSYVEILERGVNNRQKRLFLESLHSTLTTDAVNERQPFPKAYLPLITSLRDLGKF